MNWNTFTLSNGLTIVHQPSDSLIAHAAIIINAGSRDELPYEHGLAHFIEHVIFKGTKKRKPYHIIARLEDSGGELNAYTSKEETCIHASFLKDDYERAFELISDVFFNAVFPEKEIEKEKDVVIDEINSYKDNPAELIFDDFEESIFPDHPLGRNILGTPKSLKRFTRMDILNFIQRKYCPTKIVIATIGDISFSKLVKLAQKYFEQSFGLLFENNRHIPIYKPIQHTLKKKTFQAHCIIGNQAFSYYHPERYQTHLMNNILAGPGMNSRLNLVLRERLGLTYNIESHYSPFSDTGIFVVYFGTDYKDLNKSIEVIHKEFLKIRQQKLGSLQLHRAKKQIIGQLAIGAESKEGLMLSAGKSQLVFGMIESLEAVYKKIENVTASQVADVANKLLDPASMSSLIYVRA